MIVAELLTQIQTFGHLSSRQKSLGWGKGWGVTARGEEPLHQDRLQPFELAYAVCGVGFRYHINEGPEIGPPVHRTMPKDVNQKETRGQEKTPTSCSCFRWLFAIAHPSGRFPLIAKGVLPARSSFSCGCTHGIRVIVRCLNGVPRSGARPAAALVSGAVLATFGSPDPALPRRF